MPVNIDINILHNFDDLLIFEFRVDALEIAEKVQVLLDRHKIEEDIVLRADTHDLSQVGYVFFDV